MKKLILVALLVVGFTTNAQGKRGKLTLEQRTEKQVKKMTADLGLNENQQSEVKALLLEVGKKREAKIEKRKEQKENATKPTKEERQVMKAEMLAQKNAMEEKMKTILTPEQYTKWQENKEEKIEKWKEKRNIHKNKK